MAYILSDLWQQDIPENERMSPQKGRCQKEMHHQRRFVTFQGGTLLGTDTHPTSKKENHRLTSALGGDMLVPRRVYLPEIL